MHADPLFARRNQHISGTSGGEYSPGRRIARVWGGALDGIFYELWVRPLPILFWRTFAHMRHSICFGEQVRGERPRAAPRVLLHAQPGRARARPVRMCPPQPHRSLRPPHFPSLTPCSHSPAPPSSFTNADRWIRCSSHREPYCVFTGDFTRLPLRTRPAPRSRTSRQFNSPQFHFTHSDTLVYYTCAAPITARWPRRCKSLLTSGATAQAESTLNPSKWMYNSYDRHYLYRILRLVTYGIFNTVYNILCTKLCTQLLTYS